MELEIFLSSNWLKRILDSNNNYYGKRESYVRLPLLLVFCAKVQLSHINE